MTPSASAKMILISIITFLVSFLFAVWLRDKYNTPPNLPPGPKFRFPIVGHLPYLSFDTHLDFLRWAKKYGKVFHLWMGDKLVIVVNDYHMIKEAFKMEEFSGRPDMFLFNFISEGRTVGMLPI